MENSWNYFWGGLTVIAIAMILLSTLGPGKKATPYRAPAIQNAVFRPSDCVLEMEVTAEHPKHISDDLNLPRGTTIHDAPGEEHLYIVTTPVRLEGNEMSDREVEELAVELARQLGYKGKVRKG